MAAGLADAKAGRGVKIDDAFESFSARLKGTSGGIRLKGRINCRGVTMLRSAALAKTA